MDDVDLVVIAGGAARRLGGLDKAMLPMPDGRPVLAHVLTAPAVRRIVVGPVRPVRAVRPVAGDVTWAQEDPPGGGPVAALAAGLTRVRADVVVVIAGDLPFGAGAVPSLLAALAGHDAAVVLAGGRRQYLLAAWRTASLRTALAALGEPAGAAVRTLFAGADVVEVPDRAQWSRDLDTPDDVRRHTGAVPDGWLAQRGDGTAGAAR